MTSVSMGAIITGGVGVNTEFPTVELRTSRRT